MSHLFRHQSVWKLELGPGAAQQRVHVYIVTIRAVAGRRAASNERADNAAKSDSVVE